MTPLPCVTCKSPPALEVRDGVWVARCGGCGRRTHSYPTTADATQAWNRGLVAVSKSKVEAG